MATRKFTSKKRPSRNANVMADPVKTAKRSTAPLPAAPTHAANDSREPYRRALHDAIETERGRLSQAQSMLECLHMAMENADDCGSKSGTYYPDVIEVAMDLVRESVRRLDSLYIRPLVNAV